MTTTEITDEEFARYWAHLTGNVRCRYKPHWHKGVAPWSQFQPSKPDRSAFECIHIEPTPVTTAEGREEWMELLGLHTQPVYQSPGAIRTDWLVGKPSMDYVRAATLVEAIIAAVTTATRAWLEGESR